MKPTPYKLSFVGASLSISESVTLAETYWLLRDWNAVKEKVKAENLLRARTQRSAQRVFQELTPRLQQLGNEQLEILVDGDHQEKKQILWYAICKRYTYLREFAIEVLHEKFMRLDYELTEFDYEAFFGRKADWHEELDCLAKTTRVKIKTVLFRMLREAELLSETRSIIPATFSERVVEVLSPDTPLSFQIFPVSISDLPG